MRAFRKAREIRKTSVFETVRMFISSGEGSRGEGVLRPDQRALLGERGRARDLPHGEQEVLQLRLRRILGCQRGGRYGRRDDDRWSSRGLRGRSSEHRTPYNVGFVACLKSSNTFPELDIYLADCLQLEPQRHMTFLAKKVLQQTEHVLIVEDGAQKLALESGIPTLPSGWLIDTSNSQTLLEEENDGKIKTNED